MTPPCGVPSCAPPTGRPHLALALSASVRCTEPPMARVRVSSRPSSAVPGRCCRRSLDSPGPTPSHNPSNAAGPAPPHPKPTCPGDTRTSRDERVVQSGAPVSSSRPSARSDPIPSESPAFFPLHRPSGSSPSAPAAGNNCPTTSDSRVL